MRLVTWQKAALLGFLVVGLGIPPQAFTALARQQQGPQSPAPSQPEPTIPPTKQQQQAPPKSADQAPQSAISSQSTVVNIDAVVTDVAGNIVTNLKRQNFTITDNGVPQQVTNFAPSDAPLMTVILLEYSSQAFSFFGWTSAESMTGAMWADTFLREMKPADWVALKTFDLRTTLQVDFTHNPDEIDQSLRTLGFPFFHEAVLFDAIFGTIDEMKSVKGKKSILLITRGYDTISHHRLDETYNLLKETDVTVFAIGTGEDQSLYGNSSIGYLQAKNQLNEFCRLTGGYAWFPRFGAELPQITNSVAAFLRNQYTIGFSPTTPQDGRYHKLVVSIVDNDGSPLMLNDAKGKKHKVTVYARPGYTAPKPSDVPVGH